MTVSSIPTAPIYTCQILREIPGCFQALAKGCQGHLSASSGQWTTKTSAKGYTSFPLIDLTEVTTKRIKVDAK